MHVKLWSIYEEQKYLWKFNPTNFSSMYKYWVSSNASSDPYNYSFVFPSYFCMASLPNSQCMETANSPNENTKPTVNIACIRKCIKSMPKNLKSKAMETAKFAKKIGEDDPRRIVHSVKVGLALTLVSSLYYFRPLYAGFGQAGMWAILTVVLVFEFTVGEFKNISVSSIDILHCVISKFTIMCVCGSHSCLDFFFFFSHVYSIFWNDIITVRYWLDTNYQNGSTFQLSNKRFEVIILAGDVCVTKFDPVGPLWFSLYIKKNRIS